MSVEKKGRIIRAIRDRSMRRRRSDSGTSFTVTTGAGREPEAGRRVVQVSAQAIETSVEVKVSAQLGRESQIWELIDVVVYYHRDGGIRVRVIPPVEGEQDAGK